MNRSQVTAILGFCILCTAVVPFMLPRTATAASTLTDRALLSAIIAVTGIIVLLIAYVFRFKPVPAN
jgi:hypothetical protein